MGYRLSYRSCHPVGREQDEAIRQAADAFNQGRTWVLSFLRNEVDNHLVCVMKPSEPEGEQSGGGSPQWLGPYEAKYLLDGLCAISRDCRVDWEIRDTYCLRPLGVIRNGECHADPEAQAEAVRNMGEVLSRRPLN